MRVSNDVLAALQAEIRTKDQAAFALGVAVAEYELAKASLALLAETVTRDGRLLRLGALQHEFDGYRATHMKIIVRATAAQAALGEAALAALGLPARGRNFTIDPVTGEVLELVAGAYVPVQEAA